MTPMRAIRTSLPPKDWDALAAEAAARDLTLAAWAREVLLASLGEAKPEPHDPDTAEWVRLLRWATTSGAARDKSRPTGVSTDPAYRRAVWAWAARQGFTI